MQSSGTETSSVTLNQKSILKKLKSDAPKVQK